MRGFLKLRFAQFKFFQWHQGSVGFGSNEQLRIVCCKPVYKAFDRICSCGNEPIVGSNSNLILTRKICGQRSSRVSEIKRRGLVFYFSVRIWYVFSISKCTGKCDLGLCMTLAVSKRMWLRNAVSDEFCGQTRF